jgi:hypothetical protein
VTLGGGDCLVHVLTSFASRILDRLGSDEATLGGATERHYRSTS